MLPLVLNHPAWDPVALRLGPIQIHWYAIMYLVGFAAGYALLRRRLRHQPYARITSPAPWTREDVEDLILGAIVGVILGGRLGYCLFYKPGYYLTHPAEILAVWQGGMSFHGGAIGVAVALLVYAWRKKRPFLEVTDLLVPAAPLGLAAGRLGNFINGELWGRPAPASLPWAMVFPQADAQPRHPSQIYQFLGEGLLLFALLWFYARRERSRGQVSGAFVFGYGVFRFVAEYFREPDGFLGLLGLGLSMGQWLCVPMIVGGALLWWLAKRAGVRAPQAAEPAEDGLLSEPAEDRSQSEGSESKGAEEDRSPSEPDADQDRSLSERSESKGDAEPERSLSERSESKGEPESEKNRSLSERSESKGDPEPKGESESKGSTAVDADHPVPPAPKPRSASDD